MQRCVHDVPAATKGGNGMLRCTRPEQVKRPHGIGENPSRSNCANANVEKVPQQSRRNLRATFVTNRSNAKGVCATQSSFIWANLLVARQTWPHRTSPRCTTSTTCTTRSAQSRCSSRWSQGLGAPRVACGGGVTLQPPPEPPPALSSSPFLPYTATTRRGTTDTTLLPGAPGRQQ